MKKYAVIGLGFGDEGKGLTTSYLCSKNKNSLVVRFNGGHQAGHTVYSGPIRHIFSNFGSGTLHGCPTYWDKKCTVDPIALINEYLFLINQGFNPKIYIDNECSITTPYDKHHNQISENANNHGSCGVGFGATIGREENFYSLKFIDLFYPKILEEKLKGVRSYYESYLTFDNEGIQEFLDACEVIRDCATIIPVNEMPIIRVSHTPLTYDNIIYEGAQGLLLDQNIGFFPNVTRSNTGLERNNLNPDEIYLVTRAYQTRHGNGYMSNENLKRLKDSIKINPEETNQEHPYQGKFRRSILDLDLLEYGINRDSVIRNHKNKTLVITCLDHINDYVFTYNGKKRTCKSEIDFILRIKEMLECYNVLVSRSPYTEGVVEHQGI